MIFHENHILFIQTKKNEQTGSLIYLSKPCQFHADNTKKRSKIRNRYNQSPHLTQDTNGKLPTSKLDIKDESQEISPFPAGDHKAATNILA